MFLQKRDLLDGQSASAAEQAYTAILDLILTRQLRPGERTSVNLLVDRIGIGRTPIKDAITRLQTEGVLTVVGRSGTTVNAIEQEEARQLFSLRRLFEDYAAPDVVKNISSSEMKKLRQLLEVLRDTSVTNPGAFASSANFVRANVEFHTVLIGAARNPFLDRFYAQIQIHAQIVTYLVFRGHDPQAARKRQTEHDGIVAALRSRDVGALRQRLRDHSDSSEKVIMRFLEEEKALSQKPDSSRGHRQLTARL
jgi:DNA-binding GntR family transcriptional regulator